MSKSLVVQYDTHEQHVLVAKLKSNTIKILFDHTSHI